MEGATSARLKWGLMAGFGLFLLVVGLVPDPTSLLSTPPKTLRITAHERWTARPFRDYRVMVQMWKANHTCRQELTVQGSYIEIDQNTCGMFWLPLMTVERLFERSTSLEAGSRCYASVQGPDCACQLMAMGAAVYDDQWGYPRVFTLDYTTVPALYHPDYWRRTWELRAEPQCAPPPETQKFAVLSFVPLP